MVGKTSVGEETENGGEAKTNLINGKMVEAYNLGIYIMRGRIRGLSTEYQVGVSSLQQNSQTLEEMSHSRLIVNGRSFGNGVPYSLEFSGGFGMPAAESLDRKWVEDNILRSTVFTVLLVFGFKARV